MNVEANRLLSFAGWPSHFPVDVRRIARAGFHAVHPEGPVQCHWCGQCIGEWRYGDQAMARHRQLDPLCPFIVDPVASGNVPAGPPSSSCCSEPTPAANDDDVDDDAVEEPDNRGVSSPEPAAAAGSRASTTADEAPSTTDAWSPGQRRPPAEPLAIPDYMDEQCRLDTFANWPITCVTPRSLARAGFYYYNKSDHVRCAWCQGVIAKWEPGDEPFAEHGKFFPSCPRVMCGPNVRLVSSADGTGSTSGSSNSSEPQPSTGIEAIGIQMHQTHRHDEFAALGVRLDSFRSWRFEHVQRPEALAAAGFYCLDSDDLVRCFHCSGGLRAWQPTDDPWHEHAKFFPRCSFVELVKGRAFVQSVQEAQQRQQQQQALGPTRLDECLSGELAERALEMGFARADVRRSLEKRLRQTGDPFPTIDELVLAILGDKIMNADVAEFANGDDLPPPRAPVDGGGDRRVAQDHDDDDDEVAGAVGGRCSVPRSPVPMVDDSLKSILMGTANDSSGRPLNLEDENRKLKDAIMCKVCMVEEVAIVFLPCGHLVSCALCATSVNDCPLCRTKIKAYVRTYLS